MKLMTILLNPDDIELIPAEPAVYSICCVDPIILETECRYVGQTINLRESIKQHFAPIEPIVELRYLMLSAKPKLLNYEILENNPTDELKIAEWYGRFQPKKSLIRDEKARERIDFLLNQSKR